MNHQQWQYLEKRSDSRKKQLYIKGRKLLASIIWSDMIVNSQSVNEAAKNWDLPIAAIEEAIKYSETHRELIELEVLQQKEYLESKGYSVEPKIINR